MRMLSKSVLGTTAVLALAIGSAACSHKREANTSVQTAAPAAEHTNPGSGYYGSAPENVNRPTSAPTGMGGGPSTDTTGTMGTDSSGGSTGTGGTMGGTETGGTSSDSSIGGGPSSGSTDMPAGDTSGTSDPTKKKKDKKSTKSTDDTGGDMGGSDKGSGSTGGTTK